MLQKIIFIYLSNDLNKWCTAQNKVMLNKEEEEEVQIWD